MSTAVEKTLAILIPCFGEDGESLGPVLRELRRSFADHRVTVYVVDDGSVVPLEPRPEWSSARFLVRVYRHVLNLGQGAALETARRAAVRDGADVVVTVDADGQHAAEDARKLVLAVHEGADVAIGNRFAGRSNIPRLRALLLGCARVFELLLTRRWFGDAHNGLRALSGKVAGDLRIEHARMAHGTGIMVALCKMRPKLRIAEVPVTIRYTEASLAKGQRATGAFTIVGDLLTHALFRPATK